MNWTDELPKTPGVYLRWNPRTPEHVHREYVIQMVGALYVSTNESRRVPARVENLVGQYKWLGPIATPHNVSADGDRVHGGT